MPDTSPPCPDAAQHAPHPKKYIAHGEWADQMLLTHTQRECPGCGRWEVWVPIAPANLYAPAVADKDCTSCGAYIAEGAPIRTDGRGGWIGECCPATAVATRPAPEGRCRAIRFHI